MSAQGKIEEAKVKNFERKRKLLGLIKVWTVDTKNGVELDVQRGYAFRFDNGFSDYIVQVASDEKDQVDCKTLTKAKAK